MRALTEDERDVVEELRRRGFETLADATEAAWCADLRHSITTERSELPFALVRRYREVNARLIG